ncbi:helix-turn-helix domain-containing protein [Streptomyces albireticuli]|uniref:Transcriptional regulator n=1 Tax=Streptomyces albireticuli TaxID=1940 RepID=A0A2A2D3F7_9ACTN|nr:helix-turn-helix transcriptional regulator [Streptomyces albireticuli]MCD9144377.1 helix-turn-helix domain-containing protein [Streptomyces albireticuli]MCD9163560.1 helix-turn-helix domain-containing protein [Streptomyces albireticuli]MCD9193054.1 helix-turn-helix domain-containing protein [Streptomyces albireticuli]PAU46064.1 transcriptional regulator [Streptomyces albireticuli]
MAARRGPTFRRRELGKELRRLREKKGYSTKEAAAAIESSDTKLNRVESGHNQLPRVRDLEDLLDFYGVTDRNDRDSLLTLHRESLSPDWYRPYQNFMPSGALLYAGLESDAVTMRAWHSQVVFGLLQTESYTRAMFMTAKPVDERTTEFVEENVALRMKRKEIVHGDDPIELRVIIDEAALRRVIGGPDVMREQYEEIERVAALDHVTVQILPQNLVTYRASANFVILDFDSKLDPVVMEDGPQVMTVSDKPREVWLYARRFDAMRESALAPVKTAEFLHRLAREIDVD